MMRRPAFTLLETVVALAIGILVMGAALTANRVIQQNAQLSEIRAQEEALVNEAIELMQLTYATQESIDADLEDAFPWLGNNSPTRVIPYRVRLQTPESNIDPQGAQWCPPSNNSCSNGSGDLVSPAGPDFEGGAYRMSSALSANGAEVIAVRRKTPNLTDPQVYDFMYLPSVGNVVSTTVFADRAADQGDWDFYRRRITLTKRPGNTPFPAIEMTVDVWPMIAGQNRTADGVSRLVIFSSTGLVFPPSSTPTPSPTPSPSPTTSGVIVAPPPSAAPSPSVGVGVGTSDI